MKRNAIEHPKTEALALFLNDHYGGQLPEEIAHNAATGMLERLFHFTQRYAPRGDVGRHPDALIAKRMGWKGDPQLLIQALLRKGMDWLERLPDGVLFVHEWSFHADNATRISLERRGVTTFADGQPVRSRKNKEKKGKGVENEDFEPHYEPEEPPAPSRPCNDAVITPLRHWSDSPSPSPAPSSEEKRAEPPGELDPPVGGQTLSLFPVIGLQSKPEPPIPEPEKPTASRRAEVRAVYPACVEAAAQYGVTWEAEAHRALQRQLEERLAEWPDAAPEILVHGIHGAWKHWQATMPPTGDRRAMLRPELVYSAGKFGLYLGVYRARAAPRLVRAATAQPLARASPDERAAGTALAQKLIDEVAARMGVGGRTP